MALNDPYDRTGQYTGGDTGKKVDGFAHGTDRRDAAVATMVGDGYRDNRQGYGAILDSIENRISAVSRFNGRGEFGYYGKGLADNYTLENVVQARTPGGGYQFSNWSPRNAEAYAITRGAYTGNPVPGTEAWYDQAMSVYDDYYNSPTSSLRGIAQGATYYQNAAALTPNLSAFQRNMQREYGALPVGVMGHVMTGPGLTAYGRQDYGPAYDWSGFVGLDDYSGLDYGFEDAQPFTGYESTDSLGFSFDDGLYSDDLSFDFAGTEDPMQGDAYGYASADIAPDTYADDYGSGYATAMGEAFGGYEGDDGFVGSAWGGDDLGSYAEFTGTDDPMGAIDYGDGYATATETLSGQEGTETPSGTAYDDDLGAYATFTGTDDPMQGTAYGPATAMPDAPPPAAEEVTVAASTPPAPTQTSLPSMVGMPAPQVQQQPKPAASWGAPPAPQEQARPQRAAAPAPQQQSVPMGVVGFAPGSGATGTETQRRSDGTIADRAGGYGGKDAFGPGDPFGGLGFSRSSYGGYADVVDSYNRATGDITRSVFDAKGNLLDSRSVNPRADERTVDGMRADGRGDADTGRSGGSLGDGSYSSDSGYNDNSPQGIL